ncbi:hypothetical protein N480_12120 [Pseudoalteromonas luteoviolacea S2607]|nr:hypothetical protein N480_12120 [Pseudoalteromonas luteoviolacea S2607]
MNSCFLPKLNHNVFCGLNIIGELIQLYEAKLAHTLNGWPVPKLLTRKVNVD